MPQGLAGVEALQRQIDRIRTARPGLRWPSHHVGICAHPHPDGGFGNPLQQAVPGRMVMRPGVDFVAHFDQQGDVVAGPETGIQAKDGGYGRRIGRILMLEALQAFLQPGFLRLHQGKRILLALDLLGQVRHALRLASLLPLSSLDLRRA